MEGIGAKMRRLGLSAGLALGFAAYVLPAHAAGDFTPPKACTGYLTVQMHGCLVSNHYRCKGDPKGDQWRVDFDAQGPVFVSRIDYETEWVESYDLSAGTHEVLQKPSKEPASFSKLLATGRDGYDFTTVTDGGKVQHITGTDRLTGKSKVISGVKLEQTAFDTKETGADGKMIWHSTGHEWINRKWRLFLAGRGVWEDSQGKVPYDNSPVLLLQKGQKGFMSTTPEFDCKTVMSQLVLPRKKAVE